MPLEATHRYQHIGIKKDLAIELPYPMDYN
jgi:hypothetical protein